MPEDRKPAPVGVEVHVLTFDEDGSVSHTAHATWDGAKAYKAGLARQNWYRLVETRPETTPAQPPTDDDEAIELYFHPEAWIETLTVQE